MRDVQEDLKFLDTVLAKIKNGEADVAYGMLMMHSNSLASDAGLCCCDGCGEWVPMAGICSDDMCVPCHENRAQAEMDARDDAAQLRIDVAVEADQINRHLWSLGGRVPLILIAAWSVVAAACGGVPCK